MIHKKIYLVGGNRYLDYLNWILPLGFELTKKLEESDLVFFAGGEDVSPSYYDENVGKFTGNNVTRDYQESRIFEKCHGINKLGICRGSQFLTVKNGFKLVQHSQHPYTHIIKTCDNKSLVASSTHHQQFLLQENGLVPPAEYKLIAWAENLSPFHLNGDNVDYNFLDYLEPEIVYYKHSEFGNSLSIQMHPEFFELNHPTIKYLQNLLQTLSII